MRKEKEKIQDNICTNMVAIIVEKYGMEEIESYKCKFYATNPPPCHMSTSCSYFVAVEDCKHRDEKETI